MERTDVAATGNDGSDVWLNVHCSESTFYIDLIMQKIKSEY